MLYDFGRDECVAAVCVTVTHMHLMPRASHSQGGPSQLVAGMKALSISRVRPAVGTLPRLADEMSSGAMPIDMGM
jgi:hypothetical protein